jgi:hypothetical protein
MSLRNIGANGSQVVASDGYQVCLFDVSSLSAPALAATYRLPAFAFDLAVSGQHAYLACGNAGFIILDLGAGSLTLRNLTDTPGLACGIAVSGDTAFVADGLNGWLSYSVVDPSAPALLRSSSAQGPVTSVAVAGMLATLANGASSAVTMDVTTPLAPVAAASFSGLANALRVSAAGDRAYLAEGEAGLAVLNAGGAPLVLQIVPPAGGSAELALKWLSRLGKRYALYRSVDPSLGRAGFSLVLENIQATPPQNSLAVTASGPAAFYIISEQ